MSLTVEIGREEELILRFPFDAELHAWLRERGGRWDGDARAWVIKKREGNSKTLEILMQLGFEVV